MNWKNVYRYLKIKGNDGKNMKIIQLLTTMSYGDAIGNHVLALNNKILKMGYQTAIYAENIDEKFSAGTIKHVSEMNKITDKDIILYHLSTGTRLNYELGNFNGKKIIIYHNITPAEFFEDYNLDTFRLCRDGLIGMKKLADAADYCLAVSEYNKKNLLSSGYTCKIDVMPILIPFKDYDIKPDCKIIDQFSKDEYKNILFTGRIAPNKKQEDIIKIFYQYQKNYNQKSRLFLVGSYKGMESYYRRLLTYVRKLGLTEVYFTGHIKFKELIAYYKIADAFICMSEHEGFCVPIVEAMYFGIPIIAYDSSAVAETLGGGGFLTDTKNPLINAGILNRLLSDERFRQILVNNENERLQDFESELIENKFENYIENFLGDKYEK